MNVAEKIESIPQRAVSAEKNEKNKDNSHDFHLPKRSFTAEFYVGLFALFGVACLAYLSVNIAGMKILNTGYYKIGAEFDNIAGLKLGAPVEIAGVRVGEVVGIALKSTTAEVTLNVRDGVTLREDDIAAIRTKGIIGDRYIKIVPGGSEQTLKQGERVKDTESAVELEEILGKFIHRM